MKQYQELLWDILKNGKEKSDRTGTGTLSVTGRMMHIDLAEGFPLLTTKKVHFKSIVHELIWMISGDTNIEYLEKNGVTIWQEWANSRGDLGPIYGRQWRNFGRGFDRDNYGVDQLAWAIKQIKTNPDSRRIIVNSWNPLELEEMMLPPCHYTFQFLVNDGKLDLHFHMRSCDVFLGLPFNIAFYALLCHMVAALTDLEPGMLVWSGTDVHLYKNHIRQAELQLGREPRPLPRLQLSMLDVNSIDDFRFSHVTLLDYNPHPAIKAEVSV